VGASKIARDITERKRADNAQAALYDFTDRLFRAGSAEDVYEAALDAITRALGCERASILLFDDAGVMKFVAWRGLSDRYRRAVEGLIPRGHATPRALSQFRSVTLKLPTSTKLSSPASAPRALPRSPSFL
jgi:GAF domain-containing protein